MGTEPHFLASCITCEAKRKAAHFSRPHASLASWEAEHPLVGRPHSRQRAGCFPGCEHHGPAGNPTASPCLLSTCQAESAGLLFHTPQPARRDLWCYYRSELNSSKISIWNEVPVELHKEGDNQKRSLTRKGTPCPPPQFPVCWVMLRGFCFCLVSYLPLLWGTFNVEYQRHIRGRKLKKQQLLTRAGQKVFNKTWNRMKPTSFHISLQFETQTRFVEMFPEDCGSSPNWLLHL